MSDKSRILITGKWWTSGYKTVRLVMKSCHCDDDDDDDDN